MRVRLLGLVLCVAVAFAAKPAEEARRLYEQGLKAERSGDFASASVLYARAAGLDPTNMMYRLRGEAAASLTKPPKPEELLPAPGVAKIDSRLLPSQRSLRPPPELQSTTKTANFHIRGNARTLFEEVAHAYGLDCVFDGDFEPGASLRFQIDSADYRQALRALQAATGTFIVPISPKVFLVAKDTQQNRARLEPYVSVTVPIPQATSAQEMTEVAQAVQQTMALERVGMDAQQGLFVIRGPVSKVLPAQALFEQLLHYHSQVSIEMDIYEVDRQLARTWGLNLPNSFSAVSSNTVTNTILTLADLARLGLDSWAFLGFAPTQLVAQMSDSSARSLMHLELRSENNKPATFHVGERYPVLTTGYFGSGGLAGNGSTYNPNNGSNGGATSQPSTFGNIQKPSSLAQGDFNEDGIPDLAATAAGSNQLAVMTGNGDGTFRDPVYYDTGNTPSSVAAADLNGDGHIDLITADSASNSLSVFLANGDGTFQTASHLAVGSNPMAVIAADFNGDGKQDLAVADANSNDVTILMGRGDGTFQAPVSLPAGSSPRALVSADFNGDGRPDLAVVNYSSNDLWIFLGQGDGTFTKTQTYTTGSGPSAVIAGQLNFDSSVDLVVADAVSNDVSIFLGDATGQFVASNRFSTGSGPVSLQIGDVNSDGIKDIAAADSGDGTMSVLLGLGDGTFETPITYNVGSGPRSIVGADFNKDGYLDLVVANYSSNDLSVLLGFGTGGFHDSGGNNYNAYGGQAFAPMPSFNFEDLGLALKVTPHVHGTESITLDLDAAVRMLSGQALNGMPIISNRQLTSQVELPEGQTAIVAGLLSTQDARAIAGIPGLSQIPGIGQLLETHTTKRESRQALILIKAHLVSLPPDESVNSAVRLGSDARPLIPD